LALPTAFRRFWTAQAISALGSRISREGLPLAAVLALHAGPAEIGALAALGGGSSVVAGLFGGGWVDRTRRRPVLIAADLVRAGLLLTIPAAALLGLLSVWQLCLVAILTAAASTIFELAAHAYLPALVGTAGVIEGNARLGTTDGLAEIAGPGLTGLLVQILTAPIAIAVDAVSYLASAALLASIRAEEAPATAAPARWTEDLATGLRACLGHDLVRPLLLIQMTRSGFGSFFAALYIVYAVTELHLGPALLGLTIAVGGAGGLIGASLAPLLGRRHAIGPALLAASFGSGLTQLLIPLAAGPPIIAVTFLMVAQFFGDALAEIAAIQSDSLRQTVLPSALMGRAGAVFHVGVGLTRVAGALLGGVLASQIGIRPTMVIAALGLVAAPLWGVASALRRLEQLPAEAA
jgi:predicted MFS family arabinose efflux permease